jgi:hypothetical protein
VTVFDFSGIMRHSFSFSLGRLGVTDSNAVMLKDFTPAASMEARSSATSPGPDRLATA